MAQAPPLPHRSDEQCGQDEGTAEVRVRARDCVDTGPVRDRRPGVPSVSQLFAPSRAAVTGTSEAAVSQHGPSAQPRPILPATTTSTAVEVPDAAAGHPAAVLVLAGDGPVAAESQGWTSHVASGPEGACVE